MKHIYLNLCSLFIVLFLTSCSNEELNVDASEVSEGVVEKYEGELVPTHQVAYTLEPALALTFDRLLPMNELKPLLEKLEQYDIPATFFASTEQLMMYPQAVEQLIEQGYSIESNALYKMNIKSLNYEDIYQLMKLNKDTIEDLTGEPTSFTHIPTKKNYKKVNQVASQLGLSGVVQYSYRLRELKTDDEETIMNYMRRAVARGGILSMNPEDYHALKYLKEAVNEVDFNILPLEEIIALDKGRKPFDEIPGADAIKKNSVLSNTDPFVHVQERTNKKEVALTFDDWANEVVVIEVLDILDEYEIQSTFYLKTKTLEENPNLARLLVERGHEVANHSHSHHDSTTLTVEQLQKDLYKAHKIITEAIQEQPKLYYRPPFGRYNEEVALAVSAMGFDVIASYDVSSYDWNMEYTEEDVINRVMDNVEPGSVIVMHISNNIHTPKVLPKVIEALQEDGYDFVLTSDWVES